MRPMAKETHIKTDKKTVGGWGAWELPFFLETPLTKIHTRYDLACLSCRLMRVPHLMGLIHQAHLGTVRLFKFENSFNPLTYS